MPRAVWMADALKDFGVPFKTVAGWETRGESVFDPVGVMNHHTADTSPTSSLLSMILSGRPDLPGPLANVYTEWDGTIYLVAAGEANHAGGGRIEVRDRALRELAPLGDAADHYPRSDNYVGNDYWIGNEVQHPGDNTPYPEAVIEAVVSFNAAICAFQGWSANRCIHHREHTYRKADMSWRGDLRGLVRKRMEQGMTTSPTFRRALDIGAEPGIDAGLKPAWDRALAAGVANEHTIPDDISTAEQTITYLDRYHQKVVAPLVARLEARIAELEAAPPGSGIQRGDSVKLV